LQLNLDQLSLNQLNTELADSNQKWKEMQDAAEKALSTISSHLGDYNNMSFVEIEQLRQNLIAAGVEIQKVDSLMDKLMNKGNDGQ
jgi:predicted  nucleic acid-binding Zn-ribbon protein